MQCNQTVVQCSSRCIALHCTDGSLLEQPCPSRGWRPSWHLGFTPDLISSFHFTQPWVQLNLPLYNLLRFNLQNIQNNSNVAITGIGRQCQLTDSLCRSFHSLTGVALFSYSCLIVFSSISIISSFTSPSSLTSPFSTATPFGVSAFKVFL